MTKPLMTPDPKVLENSNLARFMRHKGYVNYEDLHAWSINHRAAFWQSIWNDCQVIASADSDQVLINGDDFMTSRWFPGAKLNFAENLLKYRNDTPAIIALLETGERQELTYAQLHQSVARLTAEFRERGVQAGDRIAGWLPNVPEAVIAMLACASLGAVWSSCSPEFGTEGALDRFGQIEPKLLIACKQYSYNGKTFDVAQKVTAVTNRVMSIEAILWTADVRKICADRAETELRFTQRNFDDPLYVLYSSGTTGKPKCIVHGIGGTLLQHLKEHQLHVDLTRQDKLFFFTTCGWMMWNWLVSGLATGCTIVLFDGSPFHPNPHTLINLIDTESITVFGVSAKYLSALEKEGVTPHTTHDLSSLRSILSTGSPLTHESYRYVYSEFKKDVALQSMSGGTDIISCFVLGNPLLPVYEGELQSKGLGMAVDVFDDTGEPLAVGKGELVCTKSFPSSPTRFWNDPDNVKFKAAYFEKFENIWAHGDFAELTEHTGMIIHGRSDAVLNPSGVRIGTAEIYRQVETVDAVMESLCVGQTWEDDIRVVLFVVLREGIAIDDALEADIRSRIRENASPRHVPAIIVQVTDVPRTMSGKIAELAVRDMIHGLDVKNTTALANPESLEQFKELPALKS